jgi:ArsR family transcriptional regulator, arsenate/arsenite/antimonite-responsive transcriptional repressor
MHPAKGTLFIIGALWQMGNLDMGLKYRLDVSINFDTIDGMDTIFPVVFAKALADETRQQIMKCLCCCWLSVNDVVDALDGKVNQPTVSHHLKILADANLVYVRQEGRQRFYSLNQEQLTVCCGALVQVFAPDYCATVIPVSEIGQNS